MQNMLVKARAGRRTALLFRSLRRGRDLVALQVSAEPSDTRQTLQDRFNFQPLDVPQYMTMPSGHRYLGQQ